MGSKCSLEKIPAACAVAGAGAGPGVLARGQKGLVWKFLSMFILLNIGVILEGKTTFHPHKKTSKYY